MKVISKKEAAALGLKRYFTGKPCLHGHLSEFFTKGSCCQCALERMREKRKSEEFRKLQNQAEMLRRKINPEYHQKRKENSKKWFHANKLKDDFIEKTKLKNKIWNESEGGKEWKRNYVANKLKNDPIFIISSRTRSRIKEIFRKNGYKKGSRTEQILGCSFEFFKKHIEMQFTKGMTWENKGEWHIDHIVPISSAKTEEDVIKLSHFTNLRPLMALDNLKKNSKQTHLI